MGMPPVEHLKQVRLPERPSAGPHKYLEDIIFVQLTCNLRVNL